MMTLNGISTGMAPARRTGGPAVPTLIRVPALVTPSAGHRRWPTPPRGRRRLRREVRQAAVALTIGVVLSLAVLPILAGRPSMRGLSADAATSVSTDFEPIVSLSAAIEPAGPRDLGHHVVLPGFIEPDDGDEEASHGRH